MVNTPISISFGWTSPDKSASAGRLETGPVHSFCNTGPASGSQAPAYDSAAKGDIKLIRWVYKLAHNCTNIHTIKMKPTAT